MKRLACFLLLLCLPVLAEAASAPAMWNYVRVAGDVIAVYPTSQDGVQWRAFELQLTDDNFMRIECGFQATQLGCVPLALGDQVIVYAHLQGNLTCAHDGIASEIWANLVYRWNGSSYVLLTQ